MRGVLEIEPHRYVDHGDQEITRTAWGFAKLDGEPYAVYCSRWTIGHAERGAQLLVSIGGWEGGPERPAPRQPGEKPPEQPGPGSGQLALEGAEERFAFGALCFAEKGRPRFEPVDADAIEWSEQAFLGTKLTAEAAQGHALFEDAQQLMRKIVLDDERVRGFMTREGRDPKEAKRWLERAEARLQGGDDAEAVACATLALGLDPELSEALFVRGWARGRDEDFDGGIADLELYLAKHPKGKKAPRATKILGVWRKKRGAQER
ncbi:MAG: hypothetical protein KDD82_07505 [Planctomycetes bacterium]|nr:hypothetical protein [Planctomycetota bacterium]